MFSVSLEHSVIPERSAFSANEDYVGCCASKTFRLSGNYGKKPSVNSKALGCDLSQFAPFVPADTEYFDLLNVLSSLHDLSHLRQRSLAARALLTPEYSVTSGIELASVPLTLHPRRYSRLHGCERTQGKQENGSIGQSDETLRTGE